jgi:hypothetical protein
MKVCKLGLSPLGNFASIVQSLGDVLPASTSRILMDGRSATWPSLSCIFEITGLNFPKKEMKASHISKPGSLSSQ